MSDAGDTLTKGIERYNEAQAAKAARSVELAADNDRQAGLDGSKPFPPSPAVTDRAPA